MYRAFTWLYLALWQTVRAAPRRVARSASLAAIAAAVLGLGLIDFDERMAAGPVTDLLHGEAGELSLARVGLPSLPPRILALHLDPLVDDVQPGRTWILAHGEPAAKGEYQFLEVDRFRLADARPEPRDWIPETANTAPWVLVAAGIAVLAFAGHSRILITAAAMAGLGAALAWHGLHIAGFFRVVADVFLLQPVFVMAGAVLGAALGTRTAVAAPAGLTVRLAAAAAAVLLLPWSIETFALPEDPALLLPLLCLVVPTLLPALVATLLVTEGLGHHDAPETTRALLGASALIALLLTRYSHITDQYLSSVSGGLPGKVGSGH